MSEMYMSIKSVRNGYVLKFPDVEGSGMDEIVIELPELEEGSKEYQEKVRKLLQTIKDMLGEFGSKHNEYNTYITVEKTGNV